MTGKSSQGISHSGILKVVLVYALFGCLWILLSDKLVEWIFTDPAQITLVSMIKGWLYVAITSILLYSLMHRWAYRPSEAARQRRSSRRPTLFFVLLAVIIAALTGAGIYRSLISHKKFAYTQLQTITDFKTEQLNDWLRERTEDLSFIQSSFYLAEQYHRWQGAGDQISGARLQARLQRYCQPWRFSAVTLVNPKGDKLWESGSQPLTIVPALQEAARNASVQRKLIRIAPYRDSANNLSLDFAVPLEITAGHGDVPVVIMHVDLKAWLPPLLKSWPYHIKSGEIVLFRIDNGHAIYLSDLQSPTTPATGQKSGIIEQLLQTQLTPAGFSPNTQFEGEDYRGIPVIALAHAVPGTDWFLLGKINLSEICQQTQQDAAWIGFIGLLMFFITAAGFYLVRQNQRLAMAQAVYKSQSERLYALNLLSTIADSSDDAIFAKDLAGRYLLFNRAASRFVGKPADDVLGKDDTYVFPAEQAKMLMEMDRRVIAENHILTQSEALTTANGERIFLATKGPLRDAEGNIIGIFGISRDITELKRIQESLSNSEERLRLAMDATNDGLWDWDLRSGLAYLSPNYYDITGYEPDKVRPDISFLKRMVHPEDLPQAMEKISAHLQGKTPVSEVIYRLITCNGQIKWIKGRGKVVERDTEGKPIRMIGTITDISSLKFAEEALQRQTEELAQSNAELERFNRFMVGRELDMIALKQQINDLSRQLGREPPFPLSFLDKPGGPDSANSQPIDNETF